MTKRIFRFNVSPDNTALTTANVLAEDGTPATTVSLGGGTARSSSAHYQEGGFSMRLAPGGAGTLVVRLPFHTANAKGAVSYYTYGESLPPGSLVIATVRSSSGQLLRILLNTNGSVSIQNSVATLGTTAAGAWVANRQNRIEFKFDNSGGTTAGTATLSVFDGNGTTPTGTVTVSGVDIGSTAASLFEMGNPTSSSSTWVHWVDSVQLDDGATTLIGPYAPPPALTYLTYRWDSASSTYKPVTLRRWNGTAYETVSGAA